MDGVKEQLNYYIALVENSLKQYYYSNYQGYQSVVDAMKYASMGAGKRLRAAILLEFCTLHQGEINQALPFACAVEMVHAYSLIHDDLPCMDDDDLRRGKPSCHVKFGEATALLAGDALLTNAFYVMSTSDCNDTMVVKAIAELSQKAGYNGMIGGQVLDLIAEKKEISAEELKTIHLLKTSALISAAGKIGCLVANASEEDIKIAEQYCTALGLAFQITDDILDCIGTEEQLGKPIGSDTKNQKTTYITLYGIDKAKQMAVSLTEQAKTYLAPYGNKAKFLLDLADYLILRNK